MADEVRVRFAPSPTGALHIGGAHTALFNWLWARHTGGKFILRIEDTDRVRSTQEYEETIMAGMKWLNLDWDEGPDIGGDYGPYRQTERLDFYNKYARQLLDEGKAYKDGSAVIYKVPLGLDIGFDDEVYGHVDYKSDALIDGRTGVMKDIVLIKSDGFPTYNYAVVVDDHLMKISHVIRGEDHISNTPKQVLIYKALGWEMPKFAHLPMILGKDKKKLSKRHGATSVYEYRDMGYLPDSIFNFLALLGWAPKGNVEVFGRDLAIKEYELRNINRKSSVFDFDKLNFINQEHITEMPVREKFELIRPFWEEMGVDCGKLDLEYLGKCFEIMAGRGKTIKELAEFSDYLVTFAPVAARYDGSDLTEEHRVLLKKFNTDFLSRSELVTPDQMLAFAREWCDANGAKLKDIAMPLRYMLTGYKVSPGIFEVIELLGHDEVSKRLRHYNVL
ncbi:MAG: glutamate--tRNA ligase [Pyramidobacter porci]|uniref:glutamate--tRNA ligase n=1 Tax=Pyramidobacter porci TaxID=2605789 RepID=UPI002A7640B4|nr:glutamate--tRNA ligase [Pyramidobacter porci]MCI6260132.1 glutamate--tRNA ligase [Pyramidobacter sp.]MDY2647340.1 glutamate--tRNA ligase [Pyramidobacter porci]